MTSISRYYSNECTKKSGAKGIRTLTFCMPCMRRVSSTNATAAVTPTCHDERGRLCRAASAPGRGDDCSAGLSSRVVRCRPLSNVIISAGWRPL